MFKTLVQIPEQVGNKSSSAKINLIFSMFTKADGTCVKYIVRFLQKNLKIQCAEASMQASMARAFATTTPDGKCINFLKESKSEETFNAMLKAYEDALETCVCEFPNHGMIIERMLKTPH